LKKEWIHEQYYFYVRCLLSSSDQFNEVKGQTQRIDVLKRGLIMIIIFQSVSWNSISAIKYFIQMYYIWGFVNYIN
jgi:hypothetical protein